MEKFKGTQGPWQVVDDYGKYDYCVDDPQIYIWNGDEQAHKPICDMGEMGDMNYSEELANAKLIASAPEMLECLQAILKMCNSLNMKTEEYTTLIKSKNIINKALGLT